MNQIQRTRKIKSLIATALITGLTTTLIACAGGEGESGSGLPGNTGNPDAPVNETRRYKGIFYEEMQSRGWRHARRRSIIYNRAIKAIDDKTSDEIKDAKKENNVEATIKGYAKRSATALFVRNDVARLTTAYVDIGVRMVAEIYNFLGRGFRRRPRTLMQDNLGLFLLRVTDVELVETLNVENRTGQCMFKEKLDSCFADPTKLYYEDCESYAPEIKILENWWYGPNRTPAERELLVTHEYAHCVLRYINGEASHINEVYKGVALSIMHRAVGSVGADSFYGNGGCFFANNSKLYYDELTKGPRHRPPTDHRNTIKEVIDAAIKRNEENDNCTCYSSPSMKDKDKEQCLG